MQTICACATAAGGRLALIRLSGPQTRAVATRAGVAVPGPWAIAVGALPLSAGPCPARWLFAPAGRSFTGDDLLEIVVPASPMLVDAVLEHLRAAGAVGAERGAFARMALANGRMALDQAEALLGLVHAGDAAAAARAVERLQGALGAALEPCRQQLIALLAQVEAGLDFMDEEDVSTYDVDRLRAELDHLRQCCRRFRRAAVDHGEEPVVCLVGAANAGKSALFAACCGEAVLVSDRPGTTRDWLRGTWEVEGRRLRLIDTAGWLSAAAGLDAEAVAAGRALIAGADLVIACSAPDAPLPLEHDLPADRTLLLATKADLAAPADPRCSLSCSATSGAGIAALGRQVMRSLGDSAVGEARQQALLAVADASCTDLLSGSLPEDLLLAEELRALATTLGDLLGACSDDEVLDRIFSSFCIGK